MALLKFNHPVIPLRDLVVFPGGVTTLFVGRSRSVKALTEAMGVDKKIVLLTQKDPAEDDLGHPIGGDGEIISVGLSGHIDAKNQLGFKYANAKVNQSNQVINSAFPTKQDLDIVEADWKHKYNDKTSVKLGIWGKKDSISDDKDAGGNLVLEYSY